MGLKRSLKLKNETSYNPVTWAEWTLLDASVIENTKLKMVRTTIITGQALVPTAIKPSTNYGLLLNVASITGGFIQTSSGAFSSDVNITSSTGNKKNILASLSTITLNDFKLKLSNNSTEAVISNIRLYELPPGSQIEADFTNLTANQLNDLYPWFNYTANSGHMGMGGLN